MGKRRDFQKGECSRSKSKRHRTVEPDGIDSTRDSNIESVVRKVVKEELETFKQFFLFHLQSSPRLSLNQIGTSEVRRWRLDFLNRLPDILFTGNKIEAGVRAPLHIAILDVSSNEIVATGPMSNIRIEILVLDGDFAKDDVHNWSKGEFDAAVLNAREGKRPLLIGERFVTLRNGVGHIEGISFTDNSKGTRNGKFKLGARAARNACNSGSVREARSTAVIVKDKHGEAYQKHDPPDYYDELWRLRKIKKDGKYHKQLESQGIRTVQDLLRMWVRDPSSLRAKFGCPISNMIWNTIIDHATNCIIDPKLYMYRQVAPHVLILNSVFEVVGAIFEGGNYVSRDNFSEFETSSVEALKNHAYQNPEDIEEYTILSIDVSPTALPLEDASPKSSVVDMHQSGVQNTNQGKQVHDSLNVTHLLPHVLGDRCQLVDAAITPDSHPTRNFCPFQRSSSTMPSSSTTCVQNRSFEQSSGSSSTTITNKHFMNNDILSEIEIHDWSSISAMLEEETDLLPTPCSETCLDLPSSPGIVDRTNRRHRRWAILVKVVRVVFFTSERRS